jgi:ABC-type transporter Mla subunit MlaD
MRTRGVGAEAPARLRQIEDGPGSGEYLLPVENTSKSVDLDLLNNIMREPERERLSIILGELGVGLAGRGGDLNEVIRRANPALREVDAVLKLLARQNRELEQLAVDSERALAPLARERGRVGSAIANLADVAGATADRRRDLERNLQLLPAFLRELRPTMTRLGALADEMTPVVSDLGDVAPDINRFLLELGPFSSAGVPAFETLGEASVTGTGAVRTATPVIEDIRTLAARTKPVGTTLAAVLRSFERNEGLERLLDLVFYTVTSINGFDSFGHYLRAALIVNQCSTYATEPTTGCSANFRQASSSASAARVATAAPRDPVMDWTRRALRGEDPPLPSRRSAAPVAKGGAQDASQPLLDYLFGSEG